MATFTLSAHAERYISNGRSFGHFSEATASNKRKCLSSVERHLGVPVHELSLQQIRDWLDRLNLRTKKPLSDNARWNNFMALKSFFVWFADEGEVDDEILDWFFYSGDVRWRTKPMPCYSVDEIRRIFKAAAEDSARPAIAARNTMMLYFAYFLTMRISSITSLKLDAVYWDAGEGYTYFKGMGKQKFMLPRQIADPLRRYIECYRSKLFTKNPDQGFLFPSNRGGAITNEYCYEIMDKILNVVGIERSTSRGFHGLRRAGITHGVLVDRINLYFMMEISKQRAIQTIERYIVGSPELMRKAVEASSMKAVNRNTINKAERDYQESLRRKRLAREART